MFEKNMFEEHEQCLRQNCGDHSEPCCLSGGCKSSSVTTLERNGAPPLLHIALHCIVTDINQRQFNASDSDGEEVAESVQDSGETMTKLCLYQALPFGFF